MCGPKYFTIHNLTLFADTILIMDFIKYFSDQFKIKFLKEFCLYEFIFINENKIVVNVYSLEYSVFWRDISIFFTQGFTSKMK